MNTRKRDNRPTENGWRTQLYDIIFGHESRAGWAFDVGLLIAIVLSVLVVCFETLPEAESYRLLFLIAEVFFTVLFAVEYVLRILCSRNAWRYVFSFFGIVDLMAILPSIIAIFYFLFLFDGDGVSTATSSYGVVRSLRLLRVFRILKLGWLMKEANELGLAIWQARAKVVVFVGTVMITVVIAGALMYEIENPKGDQDAEAFSSIPEGIYWAIVTMTTVGYGDITPSTNMGRIVTSFLILLGYSLIIVPTGFVSAEAINQKLRRISQNKKCENCSLRGHDFDAKFCKICGANLEELDDV